MAEQKKRRTRKLVEDIQPIEPAQPEEGKRCRQTPRSDADKKRLGGRINVIAGQMLGVKRMIEEDRYCDDVLIQLSAIDNAIRSLASVVLAEHMHTCLVDEIQKGNTGAIDEIVDFFKKFQ